MAKKRRLAPRAPRQLPASADLELKVKQLFEALSQLAVQLQQLQSSLGPIPSLHTLPTKIDVHEIKQEFTSLRIYIDQAREKIGGLMELTRGPNAEFVTRSEFTAWKGAFDERITAIERQLVQVKDRLLEIRVV